MFIFNLHCQLVLRISGNMLHKSTSQCKIPIVPEEGWFGHTIKDILRCVGFCFYILDSLVKPITSLLIQRIPAGSSFRLLAFIAFSRGGAQALLGPSPYFGRKKKKSRKKEKPAE